MSDFLAANLLALQQTQPHLVRLLLDAPADPTYGLARADDGSVVLLRRQGGQTTAFSHPRQAEQRAREFADQKREQMVGREPLFFAGLRAGYEIRECFTRLTRRDWESARAIYVYEEDLNLLRLNLAAADWRALLQSGQLFFFAGPTAAQQLADFFRRDAAKLIPTQVLVLGANDLAQRALAAAQQATQENNRQTAELKKTVDECYTNLSPAELCAALLNPASLRVLMICSRWSYFLKYSTRDIRQALEAMGAKVEVLEEQAVVDRFTRRSVLEALDRLRPHVLLIIDHLRYEYADLYPAGLPFVAWIQDYMPEIYKPNVGAGLTERDLVVGYTQGLEGVGYPGRRLFQLPPLTNPALFGAAHGEPRPEHRATFAYVSNISTPHETVFANLLARYQDAGPAITKLLHRVYDDFRRRFAEGRTFEDYLEYTTRLAAIAREMKVTIPDDRQFAFLVYTNLYDSMLRHETLAWIADDGHELALWGRGWEKHPTLAKHARGVIENGPDLAEVYRGATINLHINHSQLEHARILDGLMAGGFFLARRRPSLGLLELDECLFSSRDELREKIARFLPDAAARRAVVTRNQERIGKWATYESGIRSFLTYFALQLAGPLAAETKTPRDWNELYRSLENAAARFRVNPLRFGACALTEWLIATGAAPADARSAIERLDEYGAMWPDVPWPPHFTYATRAALVEQLAEHLSTPARALLESWREAESPPAAAYRGWQNDAPLSDELKDQARRLAAETRWAWPDYRQRRPAPEAARLDEAAANAQWPSREAARYRLLAQRLARKGAAAGAWAATQKYVAAAPEQVWPLVEAIYAAMPAGRYEAAGAYREKVKSRFAGELAVDAELRQQFADAWFCLAFSCARLDEAARAISELPAAERSTDRLRMMEARVHLRRGDFARALQVMGEPADWREAFRRDWVAQYRSIALARSRGLRADDPLIGGGRVEFAETAPIPPDGPNVFHFDRARAIAPDQLLLRCIEPAGQVLLRDHQAGTWRPLAESWPELKSAGPYPAFDTCAGSVFLVDVETPALLIFDAEFNLRDRYTLPAACRFYVEDLAVSPTGAVALVDAYRAQLVCGRPGGEWRAAPLPEVDADLPLRIASFGDDFLLLNANRLSVVDAAGRLIKTVTTDVAYDGLAATTSGVLAWRALPPRVAWFDANLRETHALCTAPDHVLFHLAGVAAHENEISLVDDHEQVVLRWRTTDR